ncbi:uncharacterized protein LOC111005982 [Momordica charantia]|uniref:Uncharacterized protein LOC111005982 n=1 Tax=Momordica charantia TaxID=3673 RepID=A0A6J1BV58_MOMCH|nr:uncharacterized protein LOC111005982 [Momordica charantia]
MGFQQNFFFFLLVYHSGGRCRNRVAETQKGMRSLREKINERAASGPKNLCRERIQGCPPTVATSSSKSEAHTYSTLGNWCVTTTAVRGVWMNRNLKPTGCRFVGLRTKALSTIYLGTYTLRQSFTSWLVTRTYKKEGLSPISK